MKKYVVRLASALLALVLLIAPASALTVEQAIELLEIYYYEELPEGAYEADSLDALLSTLDPYTEYMSQEAYQAFLGRLDGEVMSTAGIGVSIEYTEQGILVKEVFSGGGAQNAQLRAGDLIVEINGTSCVPASESDQELLLGEEGSQVNVTVLRDGVSAPYTIIRRPLVIPTTRFQVLEDGTGYVICTSFGVDTGKEFEAGLKEYDSQVERWIIDLRGNAGGYTDAAVEMLGALNGPGRYLYFEDGQGGMSAEDSAAQAVTRKPVVVLIDEGSASSSELLSAGVRDTGRGVVIGSRSYGKGVAQTVLDGEVYPELFDGDGLKVTFARFYSSEANTTDRVGVIPTLLVDDAYASAVALALCGEEKDAQVGMVLDTSAFYVDPETDEAVLAALFAALPPQTSVYYNNGHVFEELPVPEVAERLGLEYESRWFSDVEESAYGRAVNAMGAYRLLNGTGGGAYSPEDKLTRAQLCVMLARVLNVNYFGENQFSDVPEGIWYAESVNAIASLGLVQGKGDGLFDPDGVLTHEEFLTVMGRMACYLNLGIKRYGALAESEYAQIIISQEPDMAAFSDWAWGSLAVLAWGLEEALEVDGDMLYAPLSQISPAAPALRGEAAAGMYAVLRGLGYLV